MNELEKTMDGLFDFVQDCLDAVCGSLFGSFTEDDE